MRWSAGFCVLPHPELRRFAVGTVIDAIRENCLSLTSLPEATLVTFVSDQLVPAVAINALESLGLPHPDTPGRWVIDPEKVARHLGQELLLAIEARSSSASSTVAVSALSPAPPSPGGISHSRRRPCQWRTFSPLGGLLPRP
jgi:hypothetical protein